MNHQTLSLAAITSLLAAGQLAAQTVIQSIDPPSASQGASNVPLTITLVSPGSPTVPPDLVPVSSVTIGGITGTSPTHVSQYVVTALFNIPAGEAAGLKDVTVIFPGQNSTTLTYTETAAFEVTGGSGPPTAASTASPSSGIAPLNVSFTDTSTGTYSTYSWAFGDGGTSTASDPSHIYTTPGTYTVSLTVDGSEGQDSITETNLNTVSDYATGLMWSQADNGAGMNWQQALAWVQTKNAENHLGFDDWRLPNAKELQTIFDYTRSPATHGTAAIDPVFSGTSITAENGSGDFPFYWTGTTHATWNGNGGWGVYHCFGTAFGYVGSSWIDVHGAGAQRSDPKFDDGTDYSTGHGPQGDAVRIDNFVRLVRTSLPTDDSVGDGITDAWRREHFGGTGTTTDSDSEASADPDGDGDNNTTEFLALTDPNDPNSRFTAQGAGDDTSFSVAFTSSSDRVYTLWRSPDMSGGSWEAVSGQTNIPGNDGIDTLTDPSPPAGRSFYRVAVAIP